MLHNINIRRILVNPVIRFDEEVWQELQNKGKPFIDTPNSVLRQMLGLSANGTEKRLREEGQEMNRINKDSIFIVVNAVGKVADKKNALECQRITYARIKYSADIVAPGRLVEAKRVLKPGTRILMHQGGGIRFQKEYGSAQIIAAGKVSASPRELTEQDKIDYRELYSNTRQYYPDRPLVGIISYDFPKGVSVRPLTRLEANYRPMAGDNYLEVKPDDARYEMFNQWWNNNY